ncbi:LPS export ABC transporter periplasmic protein LptC [Treponema sp. OttesenSCG-928-L16]|nr:LPS export ABC transporter periplasmic protein LptC [Treponema sp. OttesenSCG-928-L16]
MNKYGMLLGAGFLSAALLSCSFDYGGGAADDTGQPDIIMNDVSYVRVRDGEPLVRFEAEYVERYENRNTMEIRNFMFEQFDSGTEDVNAAGQAGSASIQLSSGNVRLDNTVLITVDSEDITIETASLDWRDKERILAAGSGDRVDIKKSDGSFLTGTGFSADVRSRTWSFESAVEGSYVYEDDEEGEAASSGGADRDGTVSE